MKTNSLAMLLMGLLLVVALAVAFLSFTYVRNMRRLQVLQLQAAAVNQNRAILRNLYAESVEYSKRNPAIQQILDTVSTKVKQGASNGMEPEQNPPSHTK